MKSRLCNFLFFHLIHRNHIKIQTLSITHLHTIQNPHGHIIKSDSAKNVEESKVVEFARQVFDERSEWDVVSATSVIGQFIKQDRHEVAANLFKRMLMINIRPNEFTFGTIIHSSIALHDLTFGKQLHVCALKTGLYSNVFVGSALLNFYAKLSTIEEAQSVFESTHNPNVVSYTTLICGYLKKERFGDATKLFTEMPEQNVVSWNAMIGGYSKTGRNEESVNLFIKMRRKGLIPTQSTFPCAISAAANIASLGMGRSFHGCAVKILGKLEVYVSNSLISFYAKCGNMEDCLVVFNKISEKNIVSWNAVICGYAHNGKGREAIDFFKKMQENKISPNGVTLLGLLLACNHAGLVNEANTYFNMMVLENPRLLNSEHYACMVNIFSRSGRFQESWKFLRALPFDPGIGFWKSVLGGCQIHSNLELGEFAAKKILAMDPEDVSSYIMLSNAHFAAGNLQAVSMIRKEMKEKGMKRTPGCSWIEIRSKVHNFVTGDRNHDQKNDIYLVLKLFLEHVKEKYDSVLMEF